MRSVWAWSPRPPWTAAARRRTDPDAHTRAFGGALETSAVSTLRWTGTRGPGSITRRRPHGRLRQLRPPVPAATAGALGRLLNSDSHLVQHLCGFPDRRAAGGRNSRRTVE